MDRKPIRVAVVGLGLIGMRRARTLRETPGAELVGVTDLDRGRVAGAKREFGIRAFPDWESAASARGVDAVVVATTNDWLSAITRAALAAGKHVLCEKPPGRNAGEAREMCAAAEGAGRVLAFGFNHRHAAHVLEARKIVAAGGIGRPLHARARYGHGARPDFEREWRADPAKAGGGELLDQGVHLIDLARLFLGDVERVHGVLRTACWPIQPLEDNAFCVLEHAAGGVALLHASITQWKNLFSFELYGDRGAVTVEGLGGSYGGERVVWHRRRAEAGPPDEEVHEYEDELGSWRRECSAFLDAIRGTPAGGAMPIATPSDGLAVMEIVEALYASAGSGRSVTCHPLRAHSAQAGMR
jgi:predicted dehydrogenase